MGSETDGRTPSSPLIEGAMGVFNLATPPILPQIEDEMGRGDDDPDILQSSNLRLEGS